MDAIVETIERTVWRSHLDPLGPIDINIRRQRNSVRATRGGVYHDSSELRAKYGPRPDGLPGWLRLSRPTANAGPASGSKGSATVRRLLPAWLSHWNPRRGPLRSPYTSGASSDRSARRNRRKPPLGPHAPAFRDQRATFLPPLDVL
jgi:hypothetical protein